MRLASKGQMTMPKESPGAKLVRELVEYGNQMRRKGKLNNLTTEEIMEMTRGPYSVTPAKARVSLDCPSLHGRA